LVRKEKSQNIEKLSENYFEAIFKFKKYHFVATP
jgi:hypothetical protein